MIPLVGIICGLTSFMKNHKHILNNLLRLEFIILNIYWLMVNCLSTLGNELYFRIFFLTLSACEGSLGLTLMVSATRRHGTDNFRTLNVLQC